MHKPTAEELKKYHESGRIKRWNTYVAFRPTESNYGVFPPFVKDEPEHLWVTTLTRRKADIIKAAIDKVRKCYGLEIYDIEAITGMQFRQ